MISMCARLCALTVLIPLALIALLFSNSSIATKSCLVQSIPVKDSVRHSRSSEQELDAHTRVKRSVSSPSSDGYEAIRITPIIDTTTLPSGDPAIDAILRHALEPAIKFMRSALRVRRLRSTLLVTPQCNTPTDYLYRRSLNGSRHVSCQSGCAKTTKCGYCGVPDSHLDSCEVCEPVSNGQFSCRRVHEAASGLNNTDAVIYVQSINVAGCASNALIAFGQTCQLDMLTDRPVAGCLNICPSTVGALRSAFASGQNALLSHTHETNESHSRKWRADREVSGGYYRQLEYTFRHELTHVFGFMSYLFAFWRDADGKPLTERDSAGLPPLDNVTQQYTWSSNVTQTRSITWRTAHGIENRTVHYIVTSNVRREVQTHFNCADLPGAELENQGGARTAFSHLEKRIYQNEVMSGSDTETRFYSRVSLAVLQDTGWYRVVWEVADSWTRGASLGCAFATRSCGEWIAQRRHMHQSASPFCDRVSMPTWRSDSTFHLTCSADRAAVAFCTLNRYGESLPSTYQYFVSSARRDTQTPTLAASMLADGDSAERYGGNDYTASDITDFCPYVREMQQLLVTPPTFQRCANRGAQLPACSNVLLETYASGSICLRSTEPWLVANCSGVFSTRVWGAGCYDVDCDHTGVYVRVGDSTLRCERELQVLSFTVRSRFYSHFGNLVCPLCTEACGIRSCPMTSANVSASDERLFDLPDHYNSPITDQDTVLQSVAADLRGQPCTGPAPGSSETCRSPLLWPVSASEKRTLTHQTAFQTLVRRIFYSFLLVIFAVLLLALTHRRFRLCAALGISRRPLLPGFRRR